MTPLPLIMAELAGARVAVRKMFSQLGAGPALKVLAGVAADQARGEPWRELSRPADTREALSRRQLGSAVLLYRNLCRVCEEPEAYDLTAAIVREASVDFLRRNVPVIKKKKVLGMTDSRRRFYLRRIQQKFFNADADMTLDGDEGLLLTVRRCRFPELLKAVGDPQLAPMFCEGDADFFDQHQPEVQLERPEIISRGGAVCDFRFHWVE